MHPKFLVLLIIIPTCSGFVDCRTACRTCRELKAEQSLLEVHCAMCEECKQRRRERMQMKGQQTVKRPPMFRQAPSQEKARPPIQHLQPQIAQGCPTPAPCPRSQEEYNPGQPINLDGQSQTCSPVEHCATQRLDYISTTSQTIQEATSTTPQCIPPPIAFPPPLPLPIPMSMRPMPYQYQSPPAETTTRETTTFTIFPLYAPSSSPSSFFPSPSLSPMAPPVAPSFLFTGPPLVPPAFPPMPYPPYYSGCYCMPLMPSCHCGAFHRPDTGTAQELSFTTERQTISTKEYFYAYVGVPKEILKE